MCSNTDPNKSIESKTEEKLELPGMKFTNCVMSHDTPIDDTLFEMIKELIVSQRDWHLDQLVELQKKVIQLKKLGYDI